MGSKQRKKLEIVFRMGIGLIFLLLAFFILTSVHLQARKQALREAEEKALIILNTNLSIHTYFTQILKPSLFQYESTWKDPDFFDPSWMSSSYAVRKIESYNRQLQQHNFFYKESVINARSPDNEADSFERSFIEELNQDPDLIYRSGVRDLDGEPYFFVLRRGEIHQQSCTRCHTDPAIAPAGLVSTYGSERGFNRVDEPGDVVSAVSIRIPLSAAYQSARTFTLRIALGLIFFFAVLFFLQAYFFANNLFKPIKVIRERMIRIASGDEHIGEQVPEPGYDELADLVSTFNLMSTNLRGEKDLLEEKVEERTNQLNKTAAQLQETLVEKELLFKEVHHRIKNNLQLVSNVLLIKEADVDAQSAQILEDCRKRINSVSSIHEILYRTEEGYRVNFTQYLEELMASFRNTSDPEQVDLQFETRIQEDVFVNIEKAVTLGLIINELLTNAVKYAFPDRNRGTILLTMSQTGDTLELALADDGIGLPADIDITRTGTVGLPLAANLAEQMGAELKIERGKGTRFSMSLEYSDLMA